MQIRTTIITDASYCARMKVGGYGFWIAGDLGKLGGGGRFHVPVVEGVNAAEMMAVCDTLETAIDKGLVIAGSQLLLQTDSIATIQGYTSQRKLTINQEIDTLARFTKLVTNYELACKFRHVKGHTSLMDARSITNRLCDKRAKYYLNLARNIGPLAQIHREMKAELKCDRREESQAQRPSSELWHSQPWRFPAGFTPPGLSKTTAPSLETLLRQTTWVRS